MLVNTLMGKCFMYSHYLMVMNSYYQLFVLHTIFMFMNAMLLQLSDRNISKTVALKHTQSDRQRLLLEAL